MNKITVNMTRETLYDFLLFHAYSKFGGFLVNILGMAIGIMGILMYSMGKIEAEGIAFYLGAAILFLGYTPFLLRRRANQQVQMNPEYCQPVEYSFCDKEGISMVYGEEKKSYTWEQVKRAVVTPKTIGIYYEDERALIIPKADFGEQFVEIFQMIARHLGMNNVRMR